MNAKDHDKKYRKYGNLIFLQMLNFFKKIFSKNLYPELEKVGGLANALNIELSRTDPYLKAISGNGNITYPPSYTEVRYLNKVCHIHIAKLEKLYLPSFWRDGVCLAQGSTDNIASLAEVIHYWLSENVQTSKLAEKYRFIQPSANAIAFDENREIEYTWDKLLNDGSFIHLRSYIELAIKDDIVNKLFPFTSMYSLCLSRCTGYPYDMENLPVVSPLLNSNSASEQLFRVVKPGTGIIGDGNAHQALKMVKDSLPHNIEPARKGTGED